MTSVAGANDRDVVPRWRGVADTLASGEFGPVRPRNPIARPTDQLDQLEYDWSTEGTESFASDFISSALLASFPERAAGAAKFLATEGSTVRLRRLGREGLGVPVDPAASVAKPSEQFDRAVVRDRIASLKKAVWRDPHNALAWAELARYYAVSGQRSQAERALRNALYVAPDNRFLLRSAACFLVHKDPGEGHDLLLRSRDLVRDPWLLSAEMALAHVAGRKPGHVKAARSLLQDEGVGPRNLTELRSQMATMEMRAGADKKARRLFVEALKEPTDNSVAQVQWATSEVTGLHVQESLLALPLAAEARTRHALTAGHWRVAADQAVVWLGDQPFSDDAAAIGSYAASIGLRDWQKAEEIADLGLRANPGNGCLLNNYAYALLEQDRIEDAKQALDRITTGTSDSNAADATRGMLAFRTGDPETGRRLYEVGISEFRSAKRPELRALASVMLAREEVRAGTPNAQQALQRAERLAGGDSTTAVKEWLADVKRSAEPAVR